VVFTSSARSAARVRRSDERHAGSWWGARPVRRAAVPLDCPAGRAEPDGLSFGAGGDLPRPTAIPPASSAASSAVFVAVHRHRRPQPPRAAVRSRRRVHVTGSVAVPRRSPSAVFRQLRHVRVAESTRTARWSRCWLSTGMDVRYVEARDGHNWRTGGTCLREGCRGLWPGPFLHVYE